MFSGLFHSGVTLSGSAGNYWAQAAVPWRKAQQLATSLNCSDVSDSKNVLECLRNADGQTLTAQYEQFNVCLSLRKKFSLSVFISLFFFIVIVVLIGVA